MRLKAIAIIDLAANKASRSTEVLGYAVDGLFERTMRDRPDLTGINQFHRMVGELMVNTLDQIRSNMHEGAIALERNQNAPDDDLGSELSARVEVDGDVLNVIWGAFQQLRLSYVKRMREMIAAKTFGLSSGVFDPRVRSRAGRRYSPTDMVYLTVRQALVDGYNNAKITDYVTRGVTGFTMDTTDDALKDRVFATSNYPQIAVEYFHPRTNNLVGAPHVST